MLYGELLVPVAGGPEEADVLSLVADFTKDLAVNVSLFYCAPDPKDMLMISADGFVAGVGATLVENLEKTTEEIWERIKKTASNFPKFSLERATGSVDIILPERAVISDLLVVSGKCASGKCILSNGFEETLLEARVPALVIKENASKSADNIAIAWDGSSQAARSVKAALPFLKRAKYVTILQITGDAAVTGSIIYEPEVLQKVLAKHEIKADILTQPQNGKATGAILLNLCEKIAADILVSGAYGHSRAREFVFGGTSRSLLKSDNGPNLIISH